MINSELRHYFAFPIHLPPYTQLLMLIQRLKIDQQHGHSEYENDLIFLIISENAQNNVKYSH